ncbi:MAG: MarR family transcriptional regulator [Mycobacterium sp.]|nr:MarR family transcriptional regulator [Mycobacterium sp.]
MEKRGLIRREAGDARYPVIALTEAGRKTIQACAPADAARVRQLFVDVFGPNDSPSCAKPPTTWSPRSENAKRPSSQPKSPATERILTLHG